MMGALFLVIFGITAEVHPTVEEVVSGWKKRETQLSTADLSWETVRDSRAKGFGFSEGERPSNPWRLRIAGSRWRVDGHALTVAGPNDRLRPAATDPARARLEFRHVLMEQRLADEQSVPQHRAVAAVITEASSGAVDSFGKLEQLLIEAAILTVRPLMLIDLEHLAATGRDANSLGRTYAIIEERPSTDLAREYWLDPENGFRIVRMIEKSRDRPVAQIDLVHGDGDNNVASGWTALRLDEEGHVFEFAQAEHTEMQINSPVASEVFDVPLPLAAAGSTAIEIIYEDVRGALRAMVDSVWLSAALPGAVLIYGIMRWRQKEHGSLGRRFVLVRTLLVALLVLAGLLALRRTPVFFPPLQESHRRLLVIWADVKGLQHRSASQADWDALSEAAQAELDAISERLEQCQRRSQQGLWVLLVGRDRVNERIRQDLIGAAEQDLPAILNAGPSDNAGRERTVAKRFEMIGDHFAGMSPYMPSLEAGDIQGPWISSIGAVWIGIASGVAIISVAILRRTLARPASLGATSDVEPTLNQTQESHSWHG